MKNTRLKILLLAMPLFASIHCNNQALLDEALKEYSRLNRDGLNEWIPLDGNLSTRAGTSPVGSGSFYFGTNRAGEDKKAGCVLASPTGQFDFTSTHFGANPFTLGMWVRFSPFPVAVQTVFSKGTVATFYNGFKMDLDPTTKTLTFQTGDGASGQNLVRSSISADKWYYLVVSYGSGKSSFYFGEYGTSIGLVTSVTSAYIQNGVNFMVLNGSMDACVDDIVNYNRVLSSSEITQNFQSLE